MLEGLGAGLEGAESRRCTPVGTTALFPPPSPAAPHLLRLDAQQAGQAARCSSSASLWRCSCS